MPTPDRPRPDIRSGNGSPPGPARYDVRHATAYTYSESVPICHNEIRLVPRDLPTQRLLSNSISVVPQPDHVSTHVDFFGNTAGIFAIDEPHERLVVTSTSRVEVEPLGHDCWQVVLHFGFKNDPDVPEALQLLAGRGIVLDDMETSYFLSRDSVVPTFARGMWLWREKLFASMHRNAAAAADFLYLPANRIVELGSKVEI
jgi:hypothetical protein